LNPIRTTARNEQIEGMLNKYDGHQFTTYRLDPAEEGSPRDSFIESLSIDSGETLWTGSQEGYTDNDPTTGELIVWRTTELGIALP